VANRNGGFVSKVTPVAAVTRIAEHGFTGALALGQDGSLLSMQVAGGGQQNLRVLAPLQAGAATQARSCGSPICGGSISPNRPFAAIAADGTVYTTWQDANFISVTSGPLSEVNPPIAIFAGATDLLNRPAGWLDGTGADARFNAPSAIAIGPDGNLYVADTNNHVIRRITPQGVVSTFAGTGTVAGSSDGALLSATFNRPLNLGFDSEGALWVQEIGPANAPRTGLRKVAGGLVSTPVADLQAEIDTVAGGPASSAVVNGFTRSYGGMAVIGPKRLAFTVTHALLVLTLP
jgi:DNA-binding beta-propeller fold protein YncE